VAKERILLKEEEEAETTREAETERFEVRTSKPLKKGCYAPLFIAGLKRVGKFRWL
jgi:hypothetical protein